MENILKRIEGDGIGPVVKIAVVSSLEHSIPGDLPPLYLEQVKNLVGGSSLGRVQR